MNSSKIWFIALVDGPQSTNLTKLRGKRKKQEKWVSSFLGHAALYILKIFVKSRADLAPKALVKTCQNQKKKWPQNKNTADEWTSKQNKYKIKCLLLSCAPSLSAHTHMTLRCFWCYGRKGAPRTMLRTTVVLDWAC